MYGKRSGRVSVSKIQYMELVDRVEKLESIVYGNQSEESDGMTKPEVIEALKASGIEFNPRDKKEVLLALLNEKEADECPSESTEQV